QDLLLDRNSFPTRRSSDLRRRKSGACCTRWRSGRERLHDSTGHSYEIERLHASSSLLSHRSTQLRVAQQPLQRRRQLVRAPGSDKQSHPAVEDDLRNRRRPARDDGKTGRHGLDIDDPEALLNAGQAKAVGPSIFYGEGRARDMPEEDDAVAKAVPGGQRPEAGG